MDNASIFNRSVWDVTGLAHDVWVTVGDNAKGGSVRMPLAGSIKGQLWLGTSLAPRDFRPRGDFKAYATRWEQRHSVLNPDRTGMDFAPVVSARSRVTYDLPPIVGGAQDVYPVVGHYGTAAANAIIVPRKFATKTIAADRTNALEGLLDQGIKAYVELGYPPYGDWGPFADPDNVGPNHFTVLTDPDGEILMVLDAFGSEPGLESEDPLSDLMVASALLNLVKVGGRVVLRMASKRAARKAALAAAALAAAKRAALGDFETLTESEVESILGGAKNPKGPLISAEDLNKEVTQIREGMGPKRRLEGLEVPGARQVIGVLERFRLNPRDETIWSGLGKRRIKKMQFGTYARDGWIEIDVLEENSALNVMRVIFRPIPGDIEARLLQVH